MASSFRLSPFLLWELAGPFRVRAVIVLGLMVIDSALASLGIGMIIPITGAVLLPDGEVSGGHALFGWLDRLTYQQRIGWLAAMTVLLFAVKTVFSMAHAILARDFAERMRCHWMYRIGERYLYGAFSDLATRRHGSAVNDWLNEPDVGTRFLLAYMGYLSASLLTAALLAVGFVVDWRITVTFVAGGLVTGLVLRRGAYGRIASLSGSKLRLQQELGAAMSENIAQLREIKLLGMEGRRLQAVADAAGQLKRIIVRVSVAGEAPRILGEFAAVAVFVAALTALVIGGRDAREIIPLLAFFFAAFYRLVTAAMQVISARIKALGHLRSVEHVHWLSSEPYSREGSGDTPIDKISTDIIFEDVEFAYASGEPVLRRVSFSIPKDKLTFLVGASGAGKSTILDLLMRLHTPLSGRIMANARPIEDFQLIQWRSKLGYVSQDAALFHGSIRMNVRMGQPEASEEHVVEACMLAGVQGFLAELPDGLDTVVGYRGYALSGGQAKRVAIARMLVRHPDLLILDEATSAFEQEMENAIIARVRSRFPEMGVLQITHRPDAARGADYIIGLERGSVVASGKWEDFAADERMQLMRQ